MTEECKECGKAFVPNRPFQVFCNDRCKGAYWRHRYRQQAVEEAEDRRANGNGHGTAEERQKASEVLARIVQGGQGRLIRRM
jgi:endogenous inhibitor of DNA gyrase (YacG/DUF329 family)